MGRQVVFCAGGRFEGGAQKCGLVNGKSMKIHVQMRKHDKNESHEKI